MRLQPSYNQQFTILYAFNGQESIDEVSGDNNSYDFGARMYNPRIGRFLSIDNFAGNFTFQSPYVFANNTPIMGTDVNGDSLYILTYVTGNKRGDDMFLAAAITRQNDIENSGSFDAKRDKVVLICVSDLGKIEAEVEKNIASYSKTYGKTVEFGVWSHSALQGPIGGDGKPGETSGPDAIAPNQMTPEGWGKIDFNWSEGNNRAGFYGCRSGVVNPDTKMSFSRQISTLQNFKDVTVFGQSDYSFPSQYTDYRNPSFDQTLHDFLPVEYTPLAKEASTYLRKTYMVASDKATYSTERASVIGAPAKKMNYSKNGKGVGSHYQTGDKD
jgi:RHS repeat-associated protein